MAEKIQPMALPGRWITMTVPTTMKAPKATSTDMVSCAKWPLSHRQGDPHGPAGDEERQHGPAHPG